MLEHGGLLDLDLNGGFRVYTCTNLTETGQCQTGAELRYYCEPGYNLLGYAVTTCLGNNTWWPPLGTCRRGK